MREYFIEKLGGYTSLQLEKIVNDKVRDKVMEIEKSLKHNIHFPEYVEVKTGRIHLHQCYLGNWKEGKCIEKK